MNPPRPADDPAPASDPLKHFKHREVVVYANGVKYQGVLLGADEDELYLRTSTRYLTIRMDLVSTLDLADKSIEFNATKNVDPGFYHDPAFDPDDEDKA